jgi:hypothetical protein
MGGPRRSPAPLARGSGVKTYRALKRWIAAVIIGYFLLGTTTNLTIHREIFPIFSWDLFSSIPAPQGSDYGIKILAVDGVALNPPVYFEKADTIFAKAHSIDAYSSIALLGGAVAANDQAAIDAQRAVFEPVFLSDRKNVRYVVVQRTYDLLERWQSNTFIQETELRAFETGTR